MDQPQLSRGELSGDQLDGAYLDHPAPPLQDLDLSFLFDSYDENNSSEDEGLFWPPPPPPQRPPAAPAAAPAAPPGGGDRNVTVHELTPSSLRFNEVRPRLSRLCFRQKSMEFLLWKGLFYGCAHLF